MHILFIIDLCLFEYYIYKYLGSTSLIEAVGAGNVEIVKELLQHGADVNVKDNSGWLHIF